LLIGFRLIPIPKWGVSFTGINGTSKIGLVKRWCLSASEQDR
jgi:hypothetical protein